MQLDGDATRSGPEGRSGARSAHRKRFPVIKIKEEGAEVEIVETVVGLVSNLGFPIGACCVMFSMLNKEREQHKEEMLQFSDAINNNTKMMEKVLDHMERDDDARRVHA